MEDYFIENTAVIAGIVSREPECNHKTYGEVFYEIIIDVERKSGYIDQIPMIVSERLLTSTQINLGDNIKAEGQVRTYNDLREGKNKLYVTVFARDIQKEESENDAPYFENKIAFGGYICKPPVYRVSPLGREISDIILAVNRRYNKSDYIPCIAWGRNAKYTATLPVGEKININGRIQSREYRKKDESGEPIAKVAYEVSILKIE